MRPLLLLVVPLLLAAPAIPADTGDWYEDTDVLDPSALFVFDIKSYYVWLDPGEVLSATFTWDNDEGHAAARITAPHCQDWDPECLAGYADGSTRFICRDYLTFAGPATAPSPQTVTRTATDAGWHEVTIQGVLHAAPLNFHAHITVDGAAPHQITERAFGGGIGGGVHLWCPLL